MNIGNGVMAIRPGAEGFWQQVRATLLRPPAGVQAGPAVELAKNRFSPLRVEGAVATVNVTGTLMKDLPDWVMFYWEGLVSDTRRIQRAVETAAADPEIETIVLRLDSPGGSADGLAEAGAAVFAARAVKPVIAQVDGLAASAAYYLAANASEIRMGRMDEVGSIGTLIYLLDASKAYAEAGLEAVVLKTSWFKGAAFEGTEITPEQRAEFQRIVDEYFADFRAVVQRGRGMTAEQLAAVADARVWLGADAMRLKLADRIMSMDETLQELRNQAAERSASRARTQQARATLRRRVG